MAEPIELDYGREQASPRRRRLRRAWWWTWRFVAAVLLLAVVAHTTWLAVVTVRLDRLRGRLIAAGEPTTPAALQPPVPTGTNAYGDLVSAAAIVGRDTLVRSRY